MRWEEILTLKSGAYRVNGRNSIIPALMLSRFSGSVAGIALELLFSSGSSITLRDLTRKQNRSPLKWRHFSLAIILLCVRWYCRYQLSFRDLEEMTRERDLTVDHVTIFRWVQGYAPEINKRRRPHLKMCGTSYLLGET